MKAKLIIFTILAAWAFSTPKPVSACLWVGSHKLSPWPPCKMNDIPGRQRINQLNQNLLAKVLSNAEKIIWVKKEIKEWQRLQTTANDFKDRMRGRWGEVTTNPLPALIAEYNSNSPLGRYVQLQDGTFQFVITPSTLPGMADSIYNKFKEDLSFGEFQDIPGNYQNLVNNEIRNTYNMSMSMAKEVLDHKEYVQVLGDSLARTGQSLASRYSVLESPGVAEARISRLSANLSRLRGTAFEAQARALSSRMDALERAMDIRKQTEEKVLRTINRGF